MRVPSDLAVEAGRVSLRFTFRVDHARVKSTTVDPWTRAGLWGTTYPRAESKNAFSSASPPPGRGREETPFLLPCRED